CIDRCTAHVVNLQLHPQWHCRGPAHRRVPDCGKRWPCHAAPQQHLGHLETAGSHLDTAGLRPEDTIMIKTFLQSAGLAAAVLAAAPAFAADPAQIERGRYLATAGDCIACHTAPGGPSMAGGLALASPLGAIYSTNITPSKVHGIGNYTQEQ